MLPRSLSSSHSENFVIGVWDQTNLIIGGLIPPLVFGSLAACMQIVPLDCNLPPFVRFFLAYCIILALRRPQPANLYPKVGPQVAQAGGKVTRSGTVCKESPAAAAAADRRAHSNADGAGDGGLRVQLCLPLGTRIRSLFLLLSNTHPPPSHAGFFGGFTDFSWTLSDTYVPIPPLQEVGSCWVQEVPLLRW